MVKNSENTQFKKGTSGNPAGRPKKSFSTVNAELKSKGYTSLTKADLIEAYELIFNTDEKELIRIATDKETPYGLKLIIKELNNSKSRTKALEDYRNYMFGKAKETKDITTNGESINTTINFVDGSED